jgi:DNA-binding CsgD family transcriptional regulator/tetratricopeptide (TPR) repeat protein
MDYVAVGEPMLSKLDVVDEAALAELERAGLVITESDDTVVVVRGAHPLYGEVVREELSPTSRQLVAKRLAASMLSLQRRRGDALRLAGWLLDVGVTPEPLLACEAAREAAAWLQTDLADRLIRIALDAEQSYDVLMVAGSLRRNAGDVRAAERFYLSALDVAPGDSEMFEVALTLAQLYGFYDGNPAAASAMLNHVASRVSDDMRRRQLEVEGSVFAALGQYDDVLDVAAKLLDDPARDERAEWAALSTAVWAEVQLMRLGDVDEHLARIAELAPGAVQDRAGTVDMMWALELTVHLERGQLRAGLARGDALAREAIRQGVPGGLLGYALGHLHWLSGDVTAARRSAERSIEKLRQFDSFNVVPMVEASAAILAVVDGDRQAARQWLRPVGGRTVGVNPVSPVWQARANGWVIAEDDADEAVRYFIEASRVGREGSTFAWALLAAHDAVLFDAAPLAMEEIEVMRLLPVEAPFMDLLVDHASARAAADVEGIRTCARRLEAAGANWYAANAWGAVARAETADVGRTRAATRAVMLAPAAALTVHAVEISELALRPRQLEVAMLAASGMPSRAIADSVYVSSRTVDNHLRTVYRRLGVDGRAELGGVLGLDGVHS